MSSSGKKLENLHSITVSKHFNNGKINRAKIYHENFHSTVLLKKTENANAKPFHVFSFILNGIFLNNIFAGNEDKRI
jgi:hypothetical protein